MPFDLVLIHSVVFSVAIIWDAVLYYYYTPKSFWSTCCWIISTIGIAFLLFFFTFMFVGLLSAGTFTSDFCYLALAIGGILVILFLLSALLLMLSKHRSNKKKTDSSDTFFDLLDTIQDD